MNKKNNFSKTSIVFLVIISLLFLSVNQNSTSILAIPVVHNESSSSFQALLDHAPFTIISDNNFTDYGFSGTGTRSDPYMITGYNIITATSYGISVKGTTKHFVISNCYIETVGYGISFESVTSGTATIYNTTLNENNWEGIYLDYSPSVKIINSTMTNNAFNGINLYYSPGAIIINNTLSDNGGGRGITIWHSTNSTLTNNAFYNCGVHIEDISLTNYLNFSFENNWVNGKILGYYTYTDDLIFTTPDYGQLILIYCNRPTIYNQDLSNTRTGMFLYWCDNAEIMNNTCNNNFDGIILEDCTYSTVVNNTCSYNSDDGLETVYDQGSTFANNICNNNGGYGLWLFISDNCIVNNNTCNNNVWLSIYIWSCFGNTIMNNTCIISSHWGIYLQSSDSCLITNNTIQNCADYGIYLNGFSSDNEVYLNYLTDNNLGGTSQGYDDGTDNIWFNTITLEGNWWSDWNGIPPYPLDGAANNNDPYPTGPLIIPELSTGIQIIFILSLFVVALVPLSMITKKRLKNV